MGAELFQDLDSVGSTTGNQKPFWTLKFEDEETVLAWLNAEIDYLQEQAQERHEEQRKNLATYRGIQYRGSATKTRDEQANDGQISKRTRNPRVIYNHTVDLVEQDVARMTKYRGAVATTPASDDNSDRVVAEVAEDIVEGLWEKVEIDRLLQRHRRRVRIMGEDFVFVGWNRNAGPYDNDWLSEILGKDPKTMKRGELRKAMRELKEIPRLPLLDPKTGEQLRGRDGEQLWIDKPMRQGDVTHRLLLSWDVFMQRVYAGDDEQVEYAFFRERLKTETVSAMHPDRANKIDGDTTARFFDVDLCEEVERKGEIEVWHFYHRSTDTLDQGRYIKFVRSTILRNDTNPYAGWDDRKIIPLIRTVDIDTPAVLNGDATVTHIRGPQAVYNNLVSLRVRNRFLFSHPKWFYPQRSVDKASLGNSSTMVSYQGAVPPVLSQPQLAEGNESEMMNQAEQVMQKIGGVYGVSRGDPPKGITAAVALTFLDEQENDRANVGIQNHTRAIRNIALMDLWLIADNYSPDRLADLVGQNRAAQLDDFEMSNLRDIGDLKITNSSALPQQKAARMQMVLDLRKEAPSVMNDERLVYYLDLADDKGMRSAATVAIRKARDENASLMNGAKADAPEEHEFQLQHYREHMSQMNEPSFRKLPKKSQGAFRDHVGAHEMFLWKQTLKSPPFAAAVMQEFPGFPLYYVPDEAAQIPEPTPPMGPPGGVPGGDLPPPPQQDPGLPPGIEAQVPPPDMMQPGDESLAPGVAA